jgi:hypothetical protein
MTAQPARGAVAFAAADEPSIDELDRAIARLRAK